MPGHYFFLLENPPPSNFRFLADLVKLGVINKSGVTNTGDCIVSTDLLLTIFRSPLNIPANATTVRKQINQKH